MDVLHQRLQGHCVLDFWLDKKNISINIIEDVLEYFYVIKDEKMQLQVVIHENVFRMLTAARGRKRLTVLVEKIRKFVEEGQRITDRRNRKLSSARNFYKIRVNKSLRLIYAVHREEDSPPVVTLLDIGDHDFGEKSHHEKFLKNLAHKYENLDGVLENWQPQNEPVEEIDVGQNWNFGRYYCCTDEDLLRLEQNPNAQLWWQLEEEQKKYLNQPGPIVLRGSAGSGKTTIALYRLMSWTTGGQGKSLYVTFSESLKKRANEEFNLLHRDSRKVSFKTMEEICRSLLSDEDAERFKPENYVSCAQFEAFLRKRQKSDQAEIFWEEIRGIIKGCLYLAKLNVPQKILTEKEYLNLPDIGLSAGDSLFDARERKNVYKIACLYQNWLEKHNFWDDLDMASSVLFNPKKQHCDEISQLVVDEVQDLTPFHLQILLNQGVAPAAIFLTGDADQSIYPSMFRWQRLTSQIYNYLEEKNFTSKSGKVKQPEIGLLRKNYRSSQHIVELGNRLVDWRREHLNGSGEKFESRRADGEPVAWLSKSLIGKMLKIDTVLSVDIMILVPTERMRQELIGDEGVFKNNKGSVFTIHESKGLEEKTVFLYGFFTEYFGFWPFSLKKGADKNYHRVRYQVNLLNVALTRAQDELLIVDDYRPDHWSPLENISNMDVPSSVSLLESILERVDDEQDIVRKAKELENNENWFQAAENWKKSGRDTEFFRCLGTYYSIREEWAVAAENFKKAGLLVASSKCYEKADLFDDALVVLLNSSETELELKEFLSDPKRISRLRRDFGRKIFDLTVFPPYLLSVIGFFRYNQSLLLNSCHDIGLHANFPGEKQGKNFLNRHEFAVAIKNLQDFFD